MPQHTGSPVDNPTYNLLQALVSKLEAIEAYSKYERDGDGEIFRELAEDDRRHAEQLVAALGERLGSGGMGSRSGGMGGREMGGREMGGREMGSGGMGAGREGGREMGGGMGSGRDMGGRDMDDRGMGGREGSGR